MYKGSFEFQIQKLKIFVSILFIHTCGVSLLKRKKIYPIILSTNTTHIYKTTRRNNKKTKLNLLNIYKHINICIYTLFSVLICCDRKKPKVQKYSWWKVSITCMYMRVIKKHKLAKYMFDCWLNGCVRVGTSDRRFNKKMSRPKDRKLTLVVTMNDVFLDVWIRSCHCNKGKF